MKTNSESKSDQALIWHWVPSFLAMILSCVAVQLIVVLCFGREETGQVGDAFNILGTIVSMVGTAAVAGTLFLQYRQISEQKNQQDEQSKLLIKTAELEERSSQALLAQARLLASSTLIDYQTKILEQFYREHDDASKRADWDEVNKLANRIGERIKRRNEAVSELSGIVAELRSASKIPTPTS